MGGRGYQPLQPPPPLFSRPDSLLNKQDRTAPKTLDCSLESCRRGTANLFQGPVPASSQIAACAAQRHLKSQNGLPSLLESSRLCPIRTVFPGPANSPELRSPARVQVVFALPSLPVPLAKYPSNLCHGAPALSSQSLTDIPLSLDRAGLPSSRTAISSHHDQLHPRVFDTYTRF